MSLEIRAALDTSLQKGIAALRSFIGSTLDSHSERLQGDLATLLPATRTPELDLPTVIQGASPLGHHFRLVAGTHRDRWRRLHELAVVETGSRRSRRAANRPHGRLRGARDAAREAGSS